MEYTKEDAESDYQMSIECPLCPVCGDSGFVSTMFADGIHDVPCENCHKVRQ